MKIKQQQAKEVLTARWKGRKPQLEELNEKMSLCKESFCGLNVDRFLVMESSDGPPP